MISPLYPSPRARALVARYGRETVAAQAVVGPLQHWFCADGMVAFVDTGGAWVAAGAPIAAGGDDAVARAANAFAEAALSANRRACFFGCEAPIAGTHALAIGEQAVWEAARWGLVLARAPSLRYQINRARNRGVNVRTGFDPRIAGVAARWLAVHPMPPMRFLVELDIAALARSRRVYVAEAAGEVVGFAALLDLPARRRVFLEHLVRAPDAPNGTAELLVDAAMRDAAVDDRSVTLGLAPLSGPGLPAWLRFARALGNPLYDFTGLRAFKDKLRPDAWEPVYLATRGSRLAAVYDSLRAFAGGSLARFGVRTIVTLLTRAHARGRHLLAR